MPRCPTGMLSTDSKFLRISTPRRVPQGLQDRRRHLQGLQHCRRLLQPLKSRRLLQNLKHCRLLQLLKRLRHRQGLPVHARNLQDPKYCRRRLQGLSVHCRLLRLPPSLRHELEGSSNRCHCRGSSPLTPDFPSYSVGEFAPCPAHPN